MTDEDDLDRLQQLSEELIERRRSLHDVGVALGKAHKALLDIKHWCEAYPIDLFKVLEDDELGLVTSMLKEQGIEIGAQHAQWARHLLDGILRIAKEGLGDDGS